MKTALFMYDRTGIMAAPWVTAGYKCYIVDGQHQPGVNFCTAQRLYKVGMMIPSFANLREGNLPLTNVIKSCEFVFGFPECTDLAVSGAAHFARKRVTKGEDFQQKAVSHLLFVEALGKHYGCPYGIENPVSVASTLWRKPDYSFHPYEYGGYLPKGDEHPEWPEYIAPQDAYPKKTCIWAGNGFVMPEKKPVPVPEGYSTQHKKLGGKSLKTKNIRSATPRGFAAAVFEANHKE